MVVGSLGEFVELVRLAKERGIYTIVCDGYADGPAKKIADKAYTIDVRNTDEIAAVCREEAVDGIIGSFSDLLFEEITKIAAKANLRWYAKPERIPYYREKSQTKALLKQLGVHVPKNRLLGPDFPDSDLDGFIFPLVIKPVNGYGSKGIYVVHSVQEIRDRFQEVASRSSGVMEEIQVEEYSHGREYNMMTWLSDGKVYPLSIADREKNPQAGSSLPLLNRVVYPAKAIHEIADEATAVLQKFAEANGQREGALSMQFFYNENGVEVCEIAGRLFGYEHELVTHCCGMSVEKLLLDYVYDPAAVRETLQRHTPFFQKHCAGLYFVGEQGKKIADMSCCERLAQKPCVLEYQPFYQAGEVVDNYGPKPYLVRYYLGAESRASLDAATKEFYEQMRVIADDGSCVDRKFVFEAD